MCGILYVKGSVAWEKHQEAMQILNRRGPDFTRYWRQGNTFIAHSVLHITGGRQFYQAPSNDFLAYNGEIYNYKSFGDYDNDIELINDTVKGDRRLFRSFEGPYAWIWTDGSNYAYGTDPQGERYLYRYQDSNLTIVCSEVAPILVYIDAVKQAVPYVDHTWTLQTQTPYQSIERLTPGWIYTNSGHSEMDSIWRWINPQDITAQEAQEDFDSIFNAVMLSMQSNQPSTISWSGGVDSNLILQAMPDAELLTIDCEGKDSNLPHIHQYLNYQQVKTRRVIEVDREQWAAYYRELVTQTHMPAQSWSFVGKWLVAKNMRNRILYTGLAADELFGGYDFYKHIVYHGSGSRSRFSQHMDSALWDRCLAAYGGDSKPATLLADYWQQVVGCDAPGQDRISGAWGRETRNPFMHPRIIKFALNLPWQLRSGKPLLKNRMLSIWPATQVLPKEGFAGHANDSLPWLGVDIDLTGDRYSDWRQIAQATFNKFG